MKKITMMTTKTITVIISISNIIPIKLKIITMAVR